MHKINVQITTPYLLTNSQTGEVVAGATITYKIYDETDNLSTQGNMTEVGNGLYYCQWTPDAAGVWKVILSCSNPVRNDAFVYHVGTGIEPDIYEKIDTEIESIKSEVETHPTLTEIEATTVLAKEATLTPKASQSSVDAVQTDVTAIKAKTDNLPSDPASETNVDAVETKVDAVQTDVTAIKAKTDNLPSDPADESLLEAAITTAHSTTDGKVDAIQTDVNRIVCFMDFWSDADDEVPITNSATSINLPNVVIADLPSGCTIIRVIAILKIALIRDSSASDNAINNAAMAVTVDADSGYGSTVTAINIPDNSWKVDVSVSPDRGGDVVIGDNDVASEVTANATYYLRFENAQADGSNLNLEDVQVGLRVYFTV